ncbi:MAG: sulfatase [Acidobacteriota bacterium]
MRTRLMIGHTRLHACAAMLLACSACGSKGPSEIVFDIAKNAGVAEVAGPEGARPSIREISTTLCMEQPAGTRVSLYYDAGAEEWLSFGAVPEPGAKLRRLVWIQTEGADAGTLAYEENWLARIRLRLGLDDRVSIPLPPAGGLLRLTFEVVAESASSASAAWLSPCVERRARARSSEGPPDRSQALRPASARSRSRPGLLLILLDAARADRFGCYGYRRSTTPSIDRLASQAAVFERASSEAVYTQAAVGCLLTSLYPEWHGAYLKERALNPATRTLAEILRGAGWRTAMISASPNASSLYGYDRGFECIDELYLKSSGKKRLVDAREVTDAAIRRMRSFPDGGFMLYLHYREPHAPHTPPAPYYGRFSSGYSGPLKGDNETEDIYDRYHARTIKLSPEDLQYMSDRYDENLAYADSQVGRLLDHLATAGIEDSTAVVVLGDHGEAMGEHGRLGHNALLYSEFTHIPLIIKVPGARHSTIFQRAGLIDVAPTLADLAGIDFTGLSFQGTSLVPAILEGAHLKDRPRYQRAAGPKPVYGLLDGRFHYITDSRTGRRELYDVEKDPEEHANMASRLPIKTSYMHQQLQGWIASMPGKDAGATTQKVVATPEEIEALVGLGYVAPDDGRPASEKAPE